MDYLSKFKIRDIKEIKEVLEEDEESNMCLSKNSKESNGFLKIKHKKITKFKRNKNF